MEKSTLKSYRLLKGTALAASLAVAMMVSGASDASAQVLKRTLQGGGVGAVIGAVTGGNVGKGAAIGAATGAAVGIIENQNRKAHAAPAPPPRYVAPARPPRYARCYDQLVFDIQVSLGRLGYAPGRPDGCYGRLTGGAITAYQSDNGLLVTGQPSGALYDHMRARGG